MNRQDWAIARDAIAHQTERRNTRTCIDKGHPVYRVGPYLICRSLRCDTLVVSEKKHA